MNALKPYGLVLAAAVVGAALADPTASGGGAEVVGSVLRDPFWPKGFWPESLPRPPQAGEQGGQGEPRGWRSALKLVRIDGVSWRGDRMLAIIEGRVVEPGEQVSVTMGAKRYVWRLGKIDEDGSIRFVRERVEKRESEKGKE
ncbi:hypothetical protein [Kiritimatiella glycovorans]|uniref:Uncharacterized protein n=1 Tax=Kiritimatiella glycovorans TaxID=1307763 RepID=A0A0G3EAQ3_9BACT|nr:hypothetical protein [Kiritimatiella glycovorans]AKJ63561.1 hypothetical protein L21SP4_00280 [Kiritimatiella glycovorans]